MLVLVGGDEQKPTGEDASPRRGWLCAPSVCDAERWLLREVRRLLTPTRGGRLDLSRPVRVIVSSGGQRRHLASRLAAQGSAVGVTVQTFDALAREVLSRAGRVAPDSTLFGIEVRRRAAREAALAPMTSLEAGGGALLGLVDDLLDAGFEPLHGEILAEHLDAQEVGPEPASRAAAAIRVAAHGSDALAQGRAGHRSQLWVQARAAFLEDPTRLPTRAMILYGFADATAVQADWLEALLRGLPTTLALIDPTAALGRGEAGEEPAFGAAFRARMQAAAPALEFPDAGARAAATTPTPHPLLVAPDRAAEVRAVAERVRVQLDRGVEPEAIGVVLRDLTPYRLALRTHFTRLGIPFSGAGSAGAATPVRRRLEALLALLSLEREADVETWLAAVDPRALRRVDSGAAVSRAGLRRACHVLGRVRLEEVAALQALRESPVRGLRLSVESLRVAAARVRGWLDVQAARPARAPLSEHLRFLERAVAALGWKADSEGQGELTAGLASLLALERYELDASEFGWLLERSLASAGFDALGGAGGGVAVLNVMEARSRSFESLYVLGLNRGVFPRRIEEEALLPDALRLRMREVLPELPVKREGFDEERVLFAQLLGASAAVTLSFASADEDGRELPRSPLLDALERGGALASPESVASWLAPGAGAARTTPLERSVIEGLRGGRGRFARTLERALESAGFARRVAASPGDWAAARVAVLDEVDGAGKPNPGLGPYLGGVGPLAGARSERAPAVTALEALARCPWQAFLRKQLFLEAPPDAVSTLPAASDARLLGNVVHAALDRIFGAPDTASLDALAAQPGRDVEWPSAARLSALAEAAARECLQEDGVALAGYARVLAARAMPHLEQARALDAQEPGRVLSTEVRGEAEVFDAVGQRRTVRFKADRVDRVEDGLRLTDYKTGKPKVKAMQEPKRSEAHLAKIASGETLQAALYARATQGAGRYVHLDPDLDERQRVLAVADDPETAAVLDGASATLFEALDLGAYPPRLRQLEKDEEPGACRFCDVKEACVRGDSGARRRMTRFFDAESPVRVPWEQAAAALLALGSEGS